MRVRTVRLPDDLAERLERAAESTKRSRSSLLVAALEFYLDQREDLEIALARFRDPAAEWLDHEEVGRALDLD